MSTDAFSAEPDDLPGQAFETANGARAPQQFDRTDWLSFCTATASFLRRMPAQERRVLFGLLAVFLCLALLSLVVLNPGDDRLSRELLKVYFSASYVVLAIWLGQGLMLLGAKLMKPISTSPLFGQV